MFALIRVSGKQFRVTSGQELLVDRLSVEEGSALENVEVLMVGEGENVPGGSENRR